MFSARVFTELSWPAVSFQAVVQAGVDFGEARYHAQGSKPELSDCASISKKSKDRSVVQTALCLVSLG